MFASIDQVFQCGNCFGVDVPKNPLDKKVIAQKTTKTVNNCHKKQFISLTNVWESMNWCRTNVNAWLAILENRSCGWWHRHLLRCIKPNDEPSSNSFIFGQALLTTFFWKHVGVTQTRDEQRHWSITLDAQTGMTVKSLFPDNSDLCSTCPCVWWTKNFLNSVKDHICWSIRNSCWLQIIAYFWKIGLPQLWAVFWLILRP